MGGDGIRCDRTALKNNQRIQTMNIIKRTCATCCAFNPDHTADDPACSNLVNITIHHVDAAGKPLVIKQQPAPNDWCHGHQTHEEDRAEDAAIAAFWLTLGIAPQLGLLDGQDGPVGA
jgi:hypothetical protein